MKHNEHRHENAKRIMKIAGYAKGGAVHDSDEKDVDDYNDPTDKALIKASPKAKAKVGYVNGNAPKKRLDKPSRKAEPVQLARGGAAKKKEGKTQVNVIIAGKGGEPQGAAPMPVAAPAMPPRPPMMPPQGAMPPQGMPPKPPGMMAKGGAVKMDAGAGGGLGRLEKIKAYGVKPKNKGGKCE